jgi:hypothetical protein
MNIIIENKEESDREEERQTWADIDEIQRLYDFMTLNLISIQKFQLNEELLKGDKELSNKWKLVNQIITSGIEKDAKGDFKDLQNSYITGKMIKYYVSMIIQLAVLRDLKVAPGDQYYDKSIGEVKLFAKSRKVHVSPDFSIEGVIGDVKCDFSNSIPYETVLKKVKEDYKVDKAIVILINENSLKNYVPDNYFHLCKFLYSSMRIISSQLNYMENKYKGKMVYKDKLDKSVDQNTKDSLDSAFDKLSELEISEIQDKDIMNFLDKKLDTKGLTIDKIANDVIKTTTSWMPKFVEGTIGSTEILETIKEKFSKKNTDTELSNLVIQIENDLKENKFNLNEIMENENLRKLESILRKDYKQSYITFLPGGDRDIITGQEEFQVNDGSPDTEIIRAALEIRRNETVTMLESKGRSMLSELNRNYRYLINSPQAEGETREERAIAIREAKFKLKAYKEKVNEDLSRSKITSDGSFVFKNITQSDLCSWGIGLKSIDNIVRNKLWANEIAISYLEMNYQQYKEGINFLNKLKNIRDLLKLNNIKGKNMTKEKMDLKLKFKKYHGLLNDTTLDIMFRHWDKTLEKGNGSKEIPAMNFNNLIQISVPKVSNEIEVEESDINFQKSYDDPIKQENLNKILREVNESIEMKMNNSDLMKWIKSESSMHRDIMTIGKNVCKGDKNRESAFSIGYSRSNRAIFVISGKAGDLMTGVIRVIIKTESYNRPFLGLKYIKKGKFMISKPFRLNYTFTKNWLSNLASASGVGGLALAYGEDITKSSLVLPFLITPRASFIDTLDTVGVIAGNLTRNLNFGRYEIASKLTAVSADIRISNFFNFILKEGESIKLNMKLFFKSEKTILGDMSRLNFDNREVQKFITMKIKESEEFVKQDEAKIKNIDQKINDINRIITSLRLEDKRSRNDKNKVTITKRESDIINLLSRKKSLRINIKQNKSRSEQFKDLEKRKNSITIRNKQIMLILIYMKQLLTKEIATDKKKMKSDFFVRENKFNEMAKSDVFSLRNYKDFFIDEPQKFFNFILESKDNIWNNIAASMPGFVYLTQKEIIKDIGLENKWKESIKYCNLDQHPVSTAVSSKTNLIGSKRNFALQIGKRDIIEEEKQKIQDENNKTQLGSNRKGNEIAEKEKEKLTSESDREKLRKFEETSLNREREKIMFQNNSLEETSKELRRKIREFSQSLLNKSERELDEIIEENLKKYNSKAKRSEYYRLTSDYTADALLRETSAIKEELGMKEDDEITYADMIVKHIATKGTKVILTIELKEQKGGKRAFFVQTIYNRNNNQFWDKQSTSILQLMEDDNITVSGMGKYIHIQNLMKTKNWSNITGLTGDKSKFGDTHSLRPFFESIKAQYDVGYINKATALINFHSLLGLLNRKLLVPKELLKDINMYGKNERLNREEKEKAVFDSKYFKSYIFRINEPINVIKENNVDGDIDIDFFRNSIIQGELNDIACKNVGLKKEAGFTLGVMNLLATLIGLSSVWMQRYILKTSFPWVQMIVQVHSDDTLHMFNLATANIGTIKKLREDLKSKSPEEIFSKESLRHDFSSTGGKLNSLFQTALYFILARCVSQVMSLAKCNIAEDYAEMLQVFMIVEKSNNKNQNNVKVNVTAPLLRYAVNMGTRSTHSSYTDSLRQRINAAGETIINGGNIILFIYLQKLANYLTLMEFNMKKSSTDIPPELGGSIIILPEDYMRFGFASNVLRLLGNKTGRRAMQMICVDPSTNYKDEQQQGIPQGEGGISPVSGGNFKERFINPRINLKKSKIGASQFHEILHRFGIKKDRVGDIIFDLQKELYLQELLGSKNEKVYLKRVLSKHNSKLFNDSKTVIPDFLIERAQLGYRERLIALPTINDKVIKHTSIKDYYEDFSEYARSESEVLENKGFNFLMHIYQDDLKIYTQEIFEFSSTIKHGGIEPNTYYDKPRSGKYLDFDYIRPALAVISESTELISRENLHNLVYKSKTKSLEPIILNERYWQVILDIQEWVKILLGDYWKGNDPMRVAMLGDLMKDYFMGKDFKLIYKGYSADIREHITNLYKFNFSYEKGQSVKHKTQDIQLGDYDNDNRKINLSEGGNELTSVIAAELISNKLQIFDEVKYKGDTVFCTELSTKTHLRELLKNNKNLNPQIFSGIVISLSYLKAEMAYDKLKGIEIHVSGWIRIQRLSSGEFIINSHLANEGSEFLLTLIRFIMMCIHINTIGESEKYQEIRKTNNSFFLEQLKNENPRNKGDFVIQGEFVYHNTEETMRKPFITLDQFIFDLNRIKRTTLSWSSKEFSIYPSSLNFKDITNSKFKYKVAEEIEIIHNKIPNMHQFFDKLNNLRSLELNIIGQKLNLVPNFEKCLEKNAFYSKTQILTEFYGFMIENKKGSQKINDFNKYYYSSQYQERLGLFAEVVILCGPDSKLAFFNMLFTMLSKRKFYLGSTGTSIWFAQLILTSSGLHPTTKHLRSNIDNYFTLYNTIFKEEFSE